MHTIRLTTSWEREPDGRFLRRFHWVARLAPNEQVWLTFNGVQIEADVSLNDQPLGRIAPAEGKNRFLASDNLRPTSVLVLSPCPSCTLPHDLSQIVADVCLTITSASL